MTTNAPIYYFDEQGYRLPNKVGAAGGVTKVPMTVEELTEGKVNRWNGTEWTEADPSSATTASVTDSLAKAFAYGGPGGALSTITAGPDEDGNTYVQTFGWTDGKLTSISKWVKQ